MRDAREPVIPLAVEQDEGHILIKRNGEQRAAYSVTLAPEDIGRIKAGYVCARCYEAQDEPFPKACWVCQFPMADRQMEFLAKAYQGNRRIGPTTSMADELAALELLEEQKRRASSVSAPQIIVPRSW